MRPDERAVLERATQRVTEEAANAHAIVEEAMAAGLEGLTKRLDGVAAELRQLVEE